MNDKTKLTNSRKIKRRILKKLIDLYFASSSVSIHRVSRYIINKLINIGKIIWTQRCCGFCYRQPKKLECDGTWRTFTNHAASYPARLAHKLSGKSGEGDEPPHRF